MVERKVSTAKCLCQAVSLQAEFVENNTGACHCNTCRKWGGGPLLAIDCGSSVTINDNAPVGIYNSSEWAERGFCKQCGTHLYYRLKQNNQYIVPIGLFDDAPSVEFDHQIFIDQKPDFYSFSNDTKNMTGAEVFAQFAPDE